MKPTRHPYRYDGTDVLINKLGITNQKALDRFERTLLAGRTLALPRVPITPAGYKAINKHLFHDVYDWAGKYRFVDTGRGGDPFCSHEFIEGSMNIQFKKIANEQFLRWLDRKTFAGRASEHLNELNAIHPFIEGNGRTNRAFFKILAHQAGYVIDIARIDPEAWNKASVDGYRQNYAPMAKILLGTIVDKVDPRQPHLIENHRDISEILRRNNHRKKDGPSR